VAVAVAAQDADATASRCAATLATLAELEQLQAPGLTFSIPAAYAALPRLTGRATVELQIAQKSGPGGTLTVVLDGYNAPLTAGNFAALVKRGVYDGIALTGSQADEALFALPGRSPLRASLPLEVRAQGDFEPRWRSPLDVFDGGGELPVLPLSVYGAVAASRGPQAAESDGSGLFLFRFHKQEAGLGGLSFSEGEFSVAGYVTEGGELLRQLHDGDSIRRARIVKGEENLVVPTAAPPAEESAAMIS
jgi:Cyclophilin type peptidyl-prolyl cis-trans isomerase/CLD